VLYASDLLATLSDIDKDGFDSLLVNDPQAMVGHAQFDPAVLGGYPESMIMHVGIENLLRLVVSV
jgi:hypothetical protein